MEKTTYTVNGDKVRLNIPFTKVDKERRLVSGFATLDNIDTHGEVVTADASRKAFARWRGNLREMHAPVAVGKVVDFSEQEFYNESDGRTYKGVYVTAYVSKGAPHTWEKVLDGTLSGFSVGGRIKQKGVREEGQNRVNIIEEYDLIELSLVDNPANQLANVLSIQKSADGENEYEGIATMVKTLNVFYDEDESTIMLSDKEEVEGFKNIGWVEDTEDKQDSVKKLVDEFKSNELNSEKTTLEKEQSSEGSTRIILKDGEVSIEIDGTTTTHKITKGGVTVSDEQKTQEEVEEKTDEQETAEEEKTAKAADVSEVETNEDNSLDVDGLVEKISGRVVDEVKKVHEAAKADAEESVEKAKGEFSDSLDELKKEISESLDELKGNLKNLDDRVSSVEDGTAVKKSADVDSNDNDDEDEENESFWRGGFLDANALTKV